MQTWSVDTHPRQGIVADVLAREAQGKDASWLSRHARAFLVGHALDVCAVSTLKTGPKALERGALVAGAERCVFLPLCRTSPAKNAVVTVGRMNGNDVYIPHPDISRFHAFFVEHEDHFTVMDADSTNGTFVDEVAVPRRGVGSPHPLRSRNVIRFAQVVTLYVSASDGMLLLQHLSIGTSCDWLSPILGPRPGGEGSRPRGIDEMEPTQRLFHKDAPGSGPRR